MNIRFNILILLSAFLFLQACAPQAKLLNDQEARAEIKKHIQKLASDEFEGRETATPGEKKAYEYISSQFKKAGLKPKGSKSWLQEFTFSDGVNIDQKSTQLIVNNFIASIDEDFYPLSYSANGIVTGYVIYAKHGIVDSALKHNDYLGIANMNKKIFVIESGTPEGNSPHGKYGEWADLRKKIDLAVSKGASAVIFINSDTTQDKPKSGWSMRTAPSSVPVIFAEGQVASILKDSIVTNCTVGVSYEKILKNGNNVLAYIDNKAPYTVVIGAHYDHLGYGEHGSLYRGKAEIHNGADDNASGTAVLIELGRYVKAKKMNKNNYLFAAFSGEEKGLLGSSHFVKNPTVELGNVSYMINMDMVGRIKPDEKTLIINGSGTSPRWKTLLDSVSVDGIKIRDTESGVGPSDHTSFYLKDIPVLHFFSGTHNDYHKPSDDEDKINYDGTMSVMNIIKNVLHHTENSGKLAFTKTKEDKNEDAPRFKVTLGVVPDYGYDGEGMRIDGVSDDKPAAKAGMEAGDVVIQMGEHKVHDMMSYMKALSKFSKGQTVKVKILRGNKEMEKDVTF